VLRQGGTRKKEKRGGKGDPLHEGLLKKGGRKKVVVKTLICGHWYKEQIRKKLEEMRVFPQGVEGGKREKRKACRGSQLLATKGGKRASFASATLRGGGGCEPRERKSRKKKRHSSTKREMGRTRGPSIPREKIS